MIRVYPFMLHPGVVLAHTDLPADQWSLLSPEGVFDREATLSRTEYVALWQDLPDGGVGYQARGDGGRGRVEYTFSLMPEEDCVALELAVGNRDHRPWKEVFVDVCLMQIRAPHFFDPEYSRTYVVGQSGLTPVAHLVASPQRPVFRHSGRTTDSLHFFTSGSFWDVSDVEVSGNIVLTRSVDGEWTVAFAWDQLHMVACNSDGAHGCVHADPHLGDIAPGETKRVRGRITIAHSPCEEVAKRCLESRPSGNVT